MAAWGEPDHAPHPGAALTDDDASAGAALVLADLERLSAKELEEEHFVRLCDPDAADGVRLPSRPESAGIARRLVLRVLGCWGLHQQLEAGELLTGELVANAVRHAGGRTIGLRLGRRPGLLRVEVRDSSRALPCLIAASEPGSLNGRGLMLVDALSDRWGVDLLPRGKGVWYELKLRERAEAH